MDPDQVLAELSDRSHGFVYIKRKADPARAAILKKAGILGLGFTNEEQRVYPLDQVASQVVGYAGTDNHGLAGLELGLDHTLSGKPGSETVIRDPAGQAIDVLHSTPAQEGESVTLTLDHTIQAQAEAVLRNTVDQWHAKAASAIVLDPRTGGILAMAVEKGYNANLFPIVPKDRQRNRTVTDTYEPGSTFKLVTVSAVLSDGLVTPSTAFTLPYSIHVADRIIKDAHPRGDRAADRRPDPLAVVERRDDHARREARRGAAQPVDQPFRLRPSDRDRLPRRDARNRAAARQVVGLDDRHASDRPRDRDHPGPDGRGVRGARERRRLAAAAPRRPHRLAHGAAGRSRTGSSRPACRGRC